MIDLHSDTIYRLCQSGSDYTFADSPFCITKDHLVKGGQCFALFVHNSGLTHSPWEELNILHDRFVKEMADAGISQMTSPEDYGEGSKAILTTEEGASIEGDISRLGILKSWGVMIFGFTWNYENELGYPNSTDRDIMQRGLKEKGFEAVEECERLGIAVDVSHLSDGGFWDVVRTSRKPFVASHSNSRAVTDVSRNLSDDMIKALADKGGVMGLCFHPSFLGPVPADLGKAVSRIDDMVRHVEHAFRTGGEDVIAIGTDIDGIPGALEVQYPDCFDVLFDKLRKSGFSSSVMDKFMQGNALRVFSEIESIS